ncbi:MAG: T9SS type A sorting domain-containing protein, partial [Bacteroidota bacterium]
DTVTRNGMDYARGVTVDGAGTVWVSDQINDRVLRFDNAASKPNGADADGVLGQKDFTSKVQDTSRSGMNVPRGLAVDAEGRLWVATSFNHRVMRFDNAAAKPNGADADGVLGQQDFTSAVQATTPDGMREPIGVALDQTGRLYVTDNRNNRVLWFDSAASKPNGASADGVFGQPDFTSNEDTITDRGMWGPWGVTVEKVNGRIWVADSENQRVLRFSPTAPVSVDPGDVSAPGRFALHQNYPNPFNPVTVIQYDLSERSHVTLRVFNVLGEDVATLVDEVQGAGHRSVDFVGAGLPSGVYLYRLNAGGFVETKKMSLVR